VTVFLLLISWFYLHGPQTSTLWRVGNIVLAAALALGSERSLQSFSIVRRLRFRVAFLSPFAILLTAWAGRWISGAAGPGIFWLAGTFAGAFLGGMLATAYDGGLWEDNSPPSEEVNRQVRLRHQAILGQPPPTSVMKRAFDLSLAGLGTILSAPVWILTAFLVWFEDPGPILFIKNSVGKGGVNFRQFKFRTMVAGAEDSTGPVLSTEADERVLTVGRFLRKTALDELPQLLNILFGQMSFVGPRPQRTVLVHEYLEAIPEYAERHRVLPGLAGLAQVAGDYYLTPRQKLRFDRLYIQHASLGFDLKLLFLAFLIAFWYRWRKDWDGKLPRWLLRCGG
jgi:lipopolysaccharide/colanic/teichoic acid biosynthesis glycosyltransferase